MIRLLNKDLTTTKIIPSKHVLEAWQNIEINKMGTLETGVTLDYNEPIQEAHSMAVRDPDNPNEYFIYKIHSDEAKSQQIELFGIELGYDEMRTKQYIEDYRPTNRPVNEVANRLADGTDWEVRFVDSRLPTVTTNFYFENRLAAFSELLKLTGGEIEFKVEITGRRVTAKIINIYYQQGEDRGKRFVYGHNALTVERERDQSSLFTAFVGRGHGEEVGETEEGDSTYGRRITFEDVEWSVENGDPVDKPLGQKYVEIPEATALYGHANGEPRMDVREYNDIEDPVELLNATYDDLVEEARPKVQFSSTVAKFGDTEKGEPVVIKRSDINILYKTRVYNIRKNLKNHKLSQIKVGDKIVDSPSKRQTDLVQRITNVENNTQDSIEQIRREISIVRADGIRVTWSENEPESAALNDIWYQLHPDGSETMHRWNGDFWEETASSRQLNENTNHIAEVQDEIPEIREQASRSDERLQEAIDNSGLGSLDEILYDSNERIREIEEDFENYHLREAYEIANEAFNGIGAARDVANEALNHAQSVMDNLDQLDLRGRNLLIRRNEEKNRVINIDGDIVYRDENALSTHLITVEPGEDLTFSKITFDNEREENETWWRIAWHDENENYIDRQAMDDDLYHWVVPDEAYYLQVSYHEGMQPMITRGTKQYPFSLAPEDGGLTVYDMNLEIERLDYELSLTASQSSINDLTGRIEDAELDITVNANALKLLATNTTVETADGAVQHFLSEWILGADGLEGALEAIHDDETGLSILNTRLELTAGRLERGFELLEINDEGTHSQWVADITEGYDQISSKVSMTEVLEGLHIGGRNLVIRHDETEGYIFNVNGNVQAFDDHSIMRGFIDVEPGEVLTFSRNGEHRENYVWRWNWYDENENYIDRDHSGSYANAETFQWIVPENTYYIRVSYPSDWYPKIERGNIHTDWTPAPEDVEGDYLYHVESNINQLANEIGLNVWDSNENFAEALLSLDSWRTTLTDSSGLLTEAEQFIGGFRNTIFDPESGNLSSTEQLLNGMQSTVYDSETRISAINTQLSNLWDVTITENDVRGYINEGELYIRGTGYNRNANQVIRLNGETLVNGGGIGHRMFVIDRSDLSVLRNQGFNTHGHNQSAALADAIELYDNSVIIALVTYDSAMINERLKEAFEYIGIATETLTSQRIPQAYIGIPGLTVGSAISVVSSNSSSAPYAEISTKIINGTPQGINSIGNFVGARLSVLQNQINGKVSEGDVYSQFMIDPRNVLFDANDRIILSAPNVIFDTDEAFIPSAVLESVSADKISAGTIDFNEINGINMNVSSLSGNLSNFVQTNWNSATNNNVTIDGNGLHSEGIVYIQQSGGAPDLEVPGYIDIGNAEFRSWYEHGNTRRESAIYPGYLEMEVDSNLRTSTVFLNGQNLSFDIERTDSVDRRTQLTGDSLTFSEDGSVIGRLQTERFDDGATGLLLNYSLRLTDHRIEALRNGHRNIDMAPHGNGQLRVRSYAGNYYPVEADAFNLSGGHRFNQVGTRSNIISEGALYLRTNGNEDAILMGNNINVYKLLNMHGNSITNESDIRGKTDFTHYEPDLLDVYRNLGFYNYYYSDPTMNQSEQFGLMAQDLPLEWRIYDEESGMWHINMSRQIMFNSLVAKQNIKEVDELKERITELEEELEILKSA